MSSKNIPSMFGRADQPAESPCLAPLFCDSDEGGSLPDCSIRVSYPLDLRLSGVEDADAVDKARRNVKECASGMLIRRRLQMVPTQLPVGSSPRLGTPRGGSCGTVWRRGKSEEYE